MTFGSRFTRATLRSSPRYRTLARLESYGECTQHHHKLVDWEGNLRPPGPPTSVPPLGATPAPFWTSMSQRYPRASIPLGKLLVRTLSACLFGDERCPKLVFVGDDDATDYAGALADASDLWTKFFLARNWGEGAARSASRGASTTASRGSRSTGPSTSGCTSGSIGRNSFPPGSARSTPTLSRSGTTPSAGLK